MNLRRYGNKAEGTSPNQLRFTVTGIGLATIPALLCYCDSAAVAQIPISQGNNVLCVNPSVGNDTRGNGTERAPFKTITKALQVAQPNNVIVLSNGTYSASSGETFPLVLKSSVSIQGNPYTQGRNIVIQGGGAFLSPTFARQDITILGANQARLSGVTVTNPNPRGYGLWIESSSPIVDDNTFTGNNHDGISMTGNSAPTIRSNYFYQNGANGITIYGNSRPEVQENVFEKTGFGINVAQQAVPIIVGNRIIQNRTGIVAQANSRPFLRGNVIGGNTEDGVVAIAQSQPDLGTTTQPGGNVFRQNGRYDINSASNQTIPAFGDQLTSTRTIGNVNLAGTLNPVATYANLTPSNRTLAQNPIEGGTKKGSTENGASSFPTPSSLVGSVKANSAAATGRRTLSNSSSFPFFPGRTLAQTTTVSVFPEENRYFPLGKTETTLGELPVSQPERSGGQQSTEMAPVIINVPPPVSTAQALPTPRVPLREYSRSGHSSATNLPSQTASSLLTPLPVLKPAPVEISQVVINVPPPLSTAQAASTPAIAKRSPAPGGINPPSTMNAFSLLAPPPVQTQPVSNSASTPVVESALLPVPSSKIPVGHTSKQRKVAMSQIWPAPSAQSQPPVRTTSLALHYRVVVVAFSESTQAKVRSLVPGAFRTSSNGRVIMQAGVFNDRANAADLLHLLNSHGLRATLQQMN